MSGEVRQPAAIHAGSDQTLRTVYSLWASGGSGAGIVSPGFLLLLAGVPVYVAVATRTSTTQNSRTAARGL